MESLLLAEILTEVAQPHEGITLESLHLREVGLGIGVVGVLVILWGLVLGLIQLIRSEYSNLKGKDTYQQREALRHHLGYYLLLGLEFLVAADIVHTILEPKWEDLKVLGAIVIIRTIISFSLNWELSLSAKEAKAHEKT